MSPTRAGPPCRRTCDATLDLAHESLDACAVVGLHVRLETERLLVDATADRIDGEQFAQAPLALLGQVATLCLQREIVDFVFEARHDSSRTFPSSGS